MTLPLSGPISLSDVNVELSRPANTTISLDDSAVRSLAGKPTGTVTLNDLRGKSYVIQIDDLGGHVSILYDPNFGASVSVSGDYAIIGAYFEDYGDSNQYGSGAAYIVHVSNGALAHTLANPGANTYNDLFGTSVAISGNTAVVGAPNEDYPSPFALNSGKAWVYDVPSGNVIYSVAGTVANGKFGTSVAISNNYLAVGAPSLADMYTLSGKVYVYNASNGALLHTLLNPNVYGLSANDQFGYAVAVSDNYIVAGARYEDSSDGLSSGAAYIFSAANGALLHSIPDPNMYGTSTGDYFGQSVAITDTYTVVGALYEDASGAFSTGAAYIFGTANGALLHSITSPETTYPAYNYFGQSVSISGNTIVIGAHTTDILDSGTRKYSVGKAYVYDAVSGTLLRTLNNPHANVQSYEYFGVSVSVSSNNIIIGADGANTNGMAFIYNT